MANRLCARIARRAARGARCFAGVGGLFALIAGFTVLQAGAPVRAEASRWIDHSDGATRLIAGRSVPDGPAEAAEGYWLAVQMRLSKGWKTYWRDPGEAGAPPFLDWTGSSNLGPAEVFWPAPSRFLSYGLHSLGYDRHLVLPVRIAPLDPNRPLLARLALDYMICEEVCVPVHADLELALPAPAAGGHGQSSTEDRLIADALASVPRVLHGDRPLAIAAFAAPTGEGETLIVDLGGQVPLGQPDVLVEAPSPFYVGPPIARRTLDGDPRRQQITLPVASGRRARSLAGKPVVLTVITAAGAFERRLTVAPPR